MSTNTKHLQHVRSSEYKEGSSNTLPKLPIANNLLYGELALNFAKGVETISIKNSEDEIVTFPNNTDIAILTSATTKHNNSLGFTDNGDYSPKADDKYIASASTVTEALDLLDGAIKNGEGSNIKTITSNDNSITIITGTNSVDLSAQKPIISDDYIAVEYPKYNNKTYPEGAVAVAANDGLDTVAKKLDTSISALTQAVIDDEYVIHQSIKQLTEASGLDEFGNYTGATADMTYIKGTTNLTNAVQTLDKNLNSLNNEVTEDERVIAEAIATIDNSCGFENGEYTGATVDKHFIGSANTVTDALTVLDSITYDLSKVKPIISDTYQSIAYPSVDGITYPKGVTPVAAKDDLDTVAKKIDTTVSALTQAVLDNEEVITDALHNHNDSNGFDENGKYTGATASMKYIDKSTNLTEAVQILDGVIDSSNININSISGDVQETIDDFLIITSAITRMNESLGFTENIRYNPQAEIISSYTKLSSAVDFLAETISDLTTRIGKIEEKILNT